MDDKNDTSDFLLISLVIVILFFYFLTTHWFHHIAGVWYIIKWPLMKLISITPKEVFDYGFFWVFWERDFSGNIKGVANFILDQGYTNFKDTELLNAALAEYSDFNQKEFVNYTNRLTSALYYPPIFFICYYYYFKITTKERFITTYDNKSLSIQESTIWRPIKPVVHEFDNMINGSPYNFNNWWAAAETPLNLFDRIGVLKKYKKEKDDDFEIKEEFLKLDIDKLYKHFIEELGEPWESLEKLNFEEKAVMAIILPRIHSETKESKELRDLLADLYTSMPTQKSILMSKKTYKLFFSLSFIKLNKHIKEIKVNKKQYKKLLKEKTRAKKLVDIKINQIFDKFYYKTTKKGMFKKEKEIRPEVKNIIEKHYYKKVVFLAILNQARKKSGVLAACEMIWVKKLNRGLWYVLSQAGRMAAFPEVSGTWSHFLSETKSNRRMAAPRVENAVFAADKYMFKTHDNYEPFNEYSDD